MSRLRRLRRWWLLRRASRCDLGAMQKLASMDDPDYIVAMQQAYREVLGEDLEWRAGVDGDR